MLVTDIFRKVLYMSVDACLLACIILLLKFTFKKVMGVKWHYGIWIFFGLKLLMPFTLKSEISLFNIFSLVPDKLMHYENVFPDINQNSGLVYGNGQVWPLSGMEQINNFQGTKMLGNTNGSFEGISSSFDIMSFIWIAGIIILGLCLIISNIRFKALVRYRSYPVNKSSTFLLEECKAIMGIKSDIDILIIDGLNSPSLFGILKPVILLPAGLEMKMDADEMRYIILHELAHLKRRDIAVGGIMVILLILHWFNPVLWYVYYRIRHDREVACDAYVLAHLKNQCEESYGLAILKTLKLFNGSIHTPFSVSILGSKSQIRKRIIAITCFNKKTYKLSLPAVVVLIIFGATVLTGAVEPGNALKSNTGTALQHTSMVSDKGRNNGSVLDMTKTTEHFKFYYNQSDNDYIQKLADTMEGNYNRISSDIGYNSGEKLLINIWSENEDFKKAAGETSIPDWATSSLEGNTINLLSPSYNNKVRIESLGMHEMTHIFISNMNPGNNLLWIHEGIEIYEAREIDREWVKSCINKEVRDDNIPTFAELSNPTPDIAYLNEFSYTIAEFIIHEYGNSKLNQLIKAPNDFKGVFGVDEDDFLKKWVKYLKENYS